MATPEELEEKRLAAEKKAKEDKDAADLAHLKEIGAVDENGVSYKNRFKEAERKRAEAQEKLDALNTPPAETPVDEDPWTKQQREITQQEIQKFKTKEEKDKEAVQEANKTMNNILDGLEIKNPRIKKYRVEINTKLSGLSANLKSNPNSIALIVNSVLGEHIDDILKDTTPPSGAGGDSGKRLVQVGNGADANNAVLTPTPGSGASTVIELTPEEDKYATRNGLFDKGFSNKEIRDMYKKRQDKLTAKK